MPNPPILLFYKKSIYDIYFLQKQPALSINKLPQFKAKFDQIRKAHITHYKTIADLETLLQNASIKYTKRCRGNKVDFSKHKIILTLGGDGTFLEACQHISHQLIIGVNTAPLWSIGKLCVGHPLNIKNIVDKIILDRLKTRSLCRLNLISDKTTIPFINDILIAHSNPAAISRYFLSVDHTKEEQKSSGLWISTASGSTGAIHSAGGSILPPLSKKFQYMPRELYKGFFSDYTLKGGVLSSSSGIKIISLMRKGVIFIDGSHRKIPFPYGKTIRIATSNNPVETIAI